MEEKKNIPYKNNNKISNNSIFEYYSHFTNTNNNNLSTDLQ